MKRILALSVALASALCLDARVVLPSVISHNMVIQRETEAAIFGKAAPGSRITVKPSWGKTAYKGWADEKTGRFDVRVKTPGAGGPYVIAITDCDGTVKVQNVLVGDVWFCGGQSNMEMSVGGYNGQPVNGSAEKIALARASRPIRMCTIRKASSSKVLTKSKGSWMENTPETVAATSAAAYFFADFLQEALDIPVGLLIADWGGSSIETWLSREVIDRDFASEFDMTQIDSIPKGNKHKFPTLLYNGMIAPIVPYTFKGMLWYQGETNRSRYEQYERLQPAYVAMMRETFKVPDAPFYFVQIAPYTYGAPNGYLSGYFCQSQEKTLDTIPNSGMVTTLDVGQANTIHPAAKDVVGKRLALLALAKTYGFKGFTPMAPRYKGVEFQDGAAIVTFDTFDKMGLSPMQVELTGFELAGEDRVFHPATAKCKVKKLKSNQIKVVSADVPNPVAVRYCFHNMDEGTLFNNYGIPVGPFRSDDWPYSTK